MRLLSVLLATQTAAALTTLASRRRYGTYPNPAFCEAVATASQPDACIEAEATPVVLFQVMPGLRVDGKVLRKCRVVLERTEPPPTVPSGEGEAAAAATAEPEAAETAVKEGGAAADAAPKPSESAVEAAAAAVAMPEASETAAEAAEQEASKPTAEEGAAAAAAACDASQMTPALPPQPDEAV